MKKRITITIDKDIFKKFKEVCEKEGYKVSSKIERLVYGFVKDGKK